MIKTFTTALLSILCTVLHAQQKQCNCALLVNPEYFGKVVLYKHPGGAVVKSVKNDSLKEDYLSVSVNSDSSGYFLATLKYEMSGKSYTGWIKKEKYLGTYSRNYNPKAKLPLYTDADKKSKVTYVKSEVIFCPVTRCNNKWVYTTLRVNGKEVSGWLAPDMQCANAYTTCN